MTHFLPSAWTSTVRNHLPHSGSYPIPNSRYLEYCLATFDSAGGACSDSNQSSMSLGTVGEGTGRVHCCLLDFSYK